ncbi:RDD family protein|uniref:Uncharacterized membrane protein YckC, RDD family n=1 Tax=Dendrosporobacter quercicolus TaxID=146817 RepID=A0A1H0ACM8_9FIRM|nr:RDD family protein [Dendrosporobacter quercicolus]NSL50042.1 RDD family protein [Dendrosporobacter quercicolus DSM 1736]SDN31061.1 Uncharacterized membrane protein YckC, RDD family [Dendrosporobacter quercicolus]
MENHRTIMSGLGRAAGIGSRCAAILIDGLVFLPVAYLTAAILGNSWSDGFALEGLSLYLTMLLSFAYYVYFESAIGATIGKMMIGLKVVKTDGSPCDVRSSAIRTICRLIDGLPFAYLLGAVMVWLSPVNQRLGDRLAGTVVIRKQP